RSQPTRAEHVLHVGVAEVAAHLLDDLVVAVPHHADALERVAAQPELAGQPVRVGVQREAAQQLVADGDDGRCHYWMSAFEFDGSSAPMHPIQRPGFCGPRSPADERARCGPRRPTTGWGTWTPNTSSNSKALIHHHHRRPAAA